MNFSLPAFLDIAIGLVFIYLILSLLASEIQELFAAFFQWRAKHLKMSIYRMLTGTGNMKKIEKLLKGENINQASNQSGDNSDKEKISDNEKIIKFIHKIYSHYEISSLSQSSLGFGVTKTNNLYGPSYIPPEAFAEALIDILTEEKEKLDEEQAEEKNSDLINTVIDEKLESLPNNLKKIFSRLAKKALLKKDMLDPQSNKDKQIASLMSQFQLEIENWFNRSQERTSGTYKRNSKLVLFLIGFLAAILVNAHTFNILDNLHDENVREAVVTGAISTANECQNKEGDELSKCIDANVDSALKLNKLPIGWDEESPDNVLKFDNPWKLIIYDIPGFVITGLAIMMGAPFWFDLLQKFVNVRNAGPKPPSSNSSSQTT